MRKVITAILVLALCFSLCACGSEPEVTPVGRECGVYITIEASDVYTVSCGTESGSESVSNADGSALKPGDVAHFDFAGAAAEGSAEALMSYSICLYDSKLDIIASQSFTDDFSGMARIDITVTADHRILNSSNELVCGGDTVVEMTTEKPESGVSLTVPTVIMSARPEAAEKINAAVTDFNESFKGKQLETSRKAYKLDKESLEEGQTADGFSMKRTLSIKRGDGRVLSFRTYDKTVLASHTETAITGLNYDALTGIELKLGDIASDPQKLVQICSEDILISTTTNDDYEDVVFNEGYTSTLSSLVSDGHWYFASEGLVFAVNSGSIADNSYGCFEFTVDFELISDVLKPEYLPVTLTGTSGSVTACYADKADPKLVLVGSPAQDGAFIVSAVGNIYEISLYKVTVKDSGKISLGTQLWYCSELAEGAGFAVNSELSSEPKLMLSFLRPDGSRERRLLSLGDDGEIEVVSPDGSEKGTVITDRLPYQVDLNGDSVVDKISVGEGSHASVVVSSSGSDHTLETGIAVLSGLRLYDLDGDGSFEIFADGKSDDGTAVIWAASYDHDLHSINFGAEKFASGKLSGFDEDEICVLTALNILGSYSAERSYELKGGRLVPDEAYELKNAPKLRVTADIPLDSGNYLPAGSVIWFSETDGSSYVIYEAANGDSGRINVTKADSGWQIDGRPDADYFESLPYKS